MPEDMPGRMPEDMPDRMPEGMPGRMSDRMPEGMPENLPVTKRIDVMVGITRSKAFLKHGACLTCCSCSAGLAIWELVLLYIYIIL